MMNTTAGLMLAAIIAFAAAGSNDPVDVLRALADLEGYSE